MTNVLAPPAPAPPEGPSTQLDLGPALDSAIASHTAPGFPQGPYHPKHEAFVRWHETYGGEVPQTYEHSLTGPIESPVYNPATNQYEPAFPYQDLARSGFDFENNENRLGPASEMTLPEVSSIEVQRTNRVVQMGKTALSATVRFAQRVGSKFSTSREPVAESSPAPSDPDMTAEYTLGPRSTEEVNLMEQIERGRRRSHRENVQRLRAGYAATEPRWGQTDEQIAEKAQQGMSAADARMAREREAFATGVGLMRAQEMADLARRSSASVHHPPRAARPQHGHPTRPQSAASA